MYAAEGSGVGMGVGVGVGEAVGCVLSSGSGLGTAAPVQAERVSESSITAANIVAFANFFIAFLPIYKFLLDNIRKAYIISRMPPFRGGMVI
jgi:hypothetical protein